MGYEKYVQAWKKKSIAEQKQRALLIKDALQTAASATRLLAEQYKASRVYLFGSLVREYDFMNDSDIDLAVEGLNGIRYFEAVGHLFEGEKFTINIVPIENCLPDLKEKVIKEGRLLYGTATRG